MISVLYRNTSLKLTDVQRKLSRLVQKPRVMLLWLSKAYWAQVALLLILLLFPVIMPQYIDDMLEKLYPPVTEKHLFGLINIQQPHPDLETRQTQVRVIIWTAGFGVVLFLLWLDLPKALSRAEKYARDWESRADYLLTTQPSQSMILYRTAIAMASDPDYEAQLIAKVDNLDKQLSTIALLERPINNPHHTYVLSDEDNARLDSQLNTVSARYTLETELGKGAMGVVYYAHDTLLDRHVAIKQLAIHLTDRREIRDRFQQEAKALARLTHPNIVQVYDFILDEHRACIVMEYIDGLSLEDYLQDKVILSLEHTIAIAKQLADAMAYAHSRGVIHRDFKPANVLLAENYTAKITDFGLAKITQSSVETQTGTVMGSPAFMSPEQALGSLIDERSDIYSLGITFYKMFTGKLPFEGDSKEVMVKQINCAPLPPIELNTQLPVSLNQLILSMLEKEPAARIQSMDEVSNALALLCGQNL